MEDRATHIHNWLNAHPDNRIKIITNSMLSSDNLLAQSVIDMEMGPRLLLTPELQGRGLTGPETDRMDPDLAASEEWQRLVEHPQIYLYQTGKLDSALLGNGTAHYRKLPAKFIFGKEYAFVGTANFDYRSRLFNNEMGLLLQSPEVVRDLNNTFDRLKADSYRWGSPEWLQMLKELMQAGDITRRECRNRPRRWGRLPADHAGPPRGAWREEGLPAAAARRLRPVLTRQRRRLPPLG